MQHDISAILQELFELERSLLLAYREEDPTHFNALYEQLSELSPDPAIRFGFTPRLGPHDEFELSCFAETAHLPTLPRHVCKVSGYETDNGTIFAAFVSAQNPPEGFVRLSEIYWLKMTEANRPRVLAFHQRQEAKPEHPEWAPRAGELPVLLGTASPRHVERYLPVDASDAWGHAQYQAEI